MMYNNKLAVAIKAAGKVLREFKDTVYIPFGSEYSVFVKNLNSVRAQATITVDGQVVVKDLVVPANGEVEVERFVKENSHGNRLKFIERTANIEQHRGIKVDDGLVRVEFQFEKPYVYNTVVVDNNLMRELDAYEKGKQAGRNERNWYYWPTTVYLSDTTNSPYQSGGAINASYTSGGSNGMLRSAGSAQSQPSSEVYAMNAGVASASLSSTQTNTVSDVGITVPGSISNQQFITVSSFPLELEKHVIVLKLLGESNEGQQVKQAITVKHKQECPTCGHTNKMYFRFCGQCGTSLTIV